MKPRFSVLLAAVALVIGAMALTACDPVVGITVTTTADGSDADPGDGVCEATVGVGNCTLRAAIDEGSAAWAANLTVPAGTYRLTVVDGDGSVDLDITGSVSINWETFAAVEVVSPAGQPGIEVGGGAKLTASGLSLSGGRLVVAGNAMLDRATLWPNGAFTYTGPVLAVLPGGIATLGNSDLSNYGGMVVQNEGSASFVYTRFSTLNGGPGVLTTGSGATTLQGSRYEPMGGAFNSVFAQAQHPFCQGNLPQSNGGNWSPNDSCQLTGEADLQNATISGTGTGMRFVPTWRDQIPVGVAGCGTSSTVDAVGAPRPSDNNGDGIAKCDAGNREGA